MAYIPSKDAELINWGENYTDLLTADPGKYGLDDADALDLQNYFDAFDSAYALAINPTTRTALAVAVKDGQKVLFLGVARAYAAIIRANQGVTPEDKAALGLAIPDPTPTPVPTPTTSPVIVIPYAAVGIHVMSIVDQLTPTLKAKPFGVAGCLLYRATGAVAPTDFADASLVKIVTRADALIETSGLTAGHFASYWGRWFNRKGELGPVGDRTSYIILQSA